MKTSFQNILLMLLAIFSQSGFGQTQMIATARKVAIDRADSCLSYPKHTYHIFAPLVEPGSEKLPLMVAIDPQGDGKLAVDGFKDAAQKYKAIVVGSNLIKNNDATYIQELVELIADVRNRYPVGKVLFVGGFSGGARMAIGFAASHPVDGVIACGALARPEEIQLLNCKVMCIIGMDDFNFIEAAPFVLDPVKIPSNLSIEMVKATHAWPGKDLLKLAMGNLLIPMAAPGNLAEKQNIVREYVDEQKRRINSLNQENETLKAALFARNMMGSLVFEREGSFRLLFNQLIQNPNYQRQIDELTKNIQYEAKVREAYYNALIQKDSLWWSHEIGVLNSKIETEKNEFAQLTYKRIKGFLGIVCYSLCQRFERERETKKLEQVLSVYRLVEPRNTEMIRYTKILAQMKKQK